MKKILLYFICFVVIISNIFCITSYGAEKGENTEQQVAETAGIESPEQAQENEQTQNIEEFCNAEVKSVGEVRDSEENPNVKIQEVNLVVLDGTYKGKEVTANYVISNKENYEKLQLEVEDEVYVMINGDVQGNLFVTIQSLHRNAYIWILAIIFLIAILFLYEKHSIKPILSIVFTILLAYFGLFKLVLNGSNAVLITILFGIILTVIESIINNGFNKKIWISLLGVFFGVLCSSIIALVFASLARINIDLNSQIISDIDYNFLMFVGAIIVSFGACLNLVMHIIENLDKKKIETKDFFRKDLFKLGVIYGKQQSVKFVNAIIIIFIGINFALIIVQQQTYSNLFNSFSKDYMTMGIISVISACVGIIVSVPITAEFYSLINSKKTIYKTTSENKLDGKRSLKI